MADLGMITGTGTEHRYGMPKSRRRTAGISAWRWRERHDADRCGHWSAGVPRLRRLFRCAENGRPRRCGSLMLYVWGTCGALPHLALPSS